MQSNQFQKQNAYAFIIFCFILNLIIGTYLTLFFQNYINNLKNISENEKIRNQMDKNFTVLEEKYYSLEKIENFELIQKRFERNLTVGDVIEYLEQSQLTSGARLIETKVIDAQENQIIVEIRISGEIPNMTQYLRNIDQQLLNKISNIELSRDSNVNYLQTTITIYKSTIL